MHFSLLPLELRLKGYINHQLGSLHVLLRLPQIQTECFKVSKPHFGVDFFCLFLAQGHNIINAEIHCVSHETSHNSANCNEMKYNLPLCYNSLMSQPSLKRLRR